jgi:DMSO/TMAO reductase YedYZ molybdopterin-dependent catalytic subunit
MAKTSRGKRIGFGILLGLLSGITVIAITYMADQLAGLGFPPFSLFDFMARVLPGAVVNFTIERMVDIITGLNLGSTAETAKLAEQSIALVQFVVLGGAFGGVLGALNPRRNFARLPGYGLGIGLLLAAAFVGVEAGLGFPTLGPAGSVLWLFVVFGAWGLALGWVLRGIFRARAETPEGGLSRREVLYLGGTALLAAVAGALGLGFLLRAREPEQDITTTTPAPVAARTSGSAASPSQETLAGRIQPAPGTRSEITPDGDFYRIDINTRPPSVDAANWQLEIGGLVDNPLTLTLADIRARPSVSQYITLSCISNRIGGDLISTALWTGIRLRDLLGDLGLQAEARGLYIEAADGFYETVVMEDMMDDRTLLVYAMNGLPLPQKHGFPLRIYIPNHFGMKQPKWIVRMEAVADEPPGYWVERGWSRTAFMRTTSVIDAIRVEPAGEGRTVMGGIAHAGDRGISRVEVQIDDGPQQEAQLRVPPLSPLTWVQWRFEGSFSPGDHIARVRAYDGDGELQVLEESMPYPDGATGVHTFPFTVEG